jgi:diacylglycerol kinase family enzyme
MRTRPIPAFVNLDSGSGEAAREALDAVGGFDVESCKPEHLDQRIRRAIGEGADRVVIAGGDGTIARAASALVGQKAALAIVPGGTLNHFARDHGIPVDRTKAAEISANGETTTTDVATVNGRVFLNTSSVGAYVVFVRTRERLERHVGYRLATVIAALRLLGRIHPFTVEMNLDGQLRRYRSALVFVGVGERELQLPSVGSRAENGRRGLHVIVVRGGTWARLVAAGLVAAFRGNDAVKREKLADSYVVDECRIEFRRRVGRVAVDGEIMEMSSPLDYRIHRDALRLVVPPADAADARTKRRAR